MTKLEALQKQRDLLDAQIKAQAQADAALAKAKETPRPPEVVLADIFEAISLRLGNRPELKLLIAEFKAATHQSEPTPNPPPG